MSGLDAITASGGWTIAVIAPTIVFISLSLLALMVSVLERALGIWDQTKEAVANLFKGEEAPAQAQPSLSQRAQSAILLNEEERQAALCLEMIIQRMGEPFTLAKLTEMAERLGVPHCMDHLERLQDTGCMEESKDPPKQGLFYWRGL